jgi:hypothetical protein
MNVQNLINYWSTNYYSDALSMLISILGLFIFIKKVNKSNRTFIFRYYFLAHIILKLFTFSHALFFTKRFNETMISIDFYADYLFTIFEFFVFIIFFQKSIHSNIYQNGIKIIITLFIVSSIGLLTYDLVYFGTLQIKTTYSLFNIQAILILFPCIFYYLEIFQFNPTFNLLQDSAFWVTTGIFFFMISTLPFSLLINYLRNTDRILYNSMFAIFHVFYILLFFMIIRGSKCEPITLR